MQYKRLFLVGDVAHLLAPTGGKGLNTAVNGSKILAQAFLDFYDKNCSNKLNAYTDTCLLYVWEAQLFTNNMTLLLHNLTVTSEDDNKEKNDFDDKLQQVQRRMFQQSYALQLNFAKMLTHAKY